MRIGKDFKKIISLVITITFLSANTLYSSPALKDIYTYTLRVPIQKDVGWRIVLAAIESSITLQFKGVSHEKKKAMFQLIESLGEILKKNKIDIKLRTLQYALLGHAGTGLIEQTNNIDKLNLFIKLGVALAKEKINPAPTLYYAGSLAMDATENIAMLKDTCNHLLTLNRYIVKNRADPQYVFEYVDLALKELRLKDEKFNIQINVLEELWGYIAGLEIKFAGLLDRERTPFDLAIAGLFKKANSIEEIKKTAKYLYYSLKSSPKSFNIKTPRSCL